MTDFNKINITKKSSKSNNLVHIVIPAQDHQNNILSTKNGQNTGLMGLAWMTQFGLSDTFSILHLTVKALESKKATAYTITYSSGER